ncbi:MAG: FN3 associated domain-containing protein [Verrucomicrobiota bacterium]
MLNRGTNGTALFQTNGTLLKFSINYMGYPVLVATNASHLTNATAVAVDGLGNVFITVQSNTVLKITQPGTISVAGIITNPGVNLQGIVVMDNGQLALCDAGVNSGIWLMNPYIGNITNNVTKLAGFNGVGDNSDIWPVPATNAIFNHPANIAKAGNGILVITDKDNHRVKLLNTISSTVTLLYGVKTNLWLTGQTIVLPTGSYKDPGGWLDGAAGIQLGNAESRLPSGAVVAPDGSVYVSEDYCHVIRRVTGAGLSAPVTGYPQYSSAEGIALDPAGNNLYIASPGNNQVRQLNLINNTTTTFLNSLDGLSYPVSVLVDPETIDLIDTAYHYIYVLNQDSGTNGNILVFDTFGYSFGSIATGFNQPTAFTLDGNGNIFVTEKGGTIKAVYPLTGKVSTLATIATNANVQLQGITILDNGHIAVSDAGNHVIWSVNPVTKLVSKITGQVGINGTTLGLSSISKLNQPHQLARSGSNLLVTDSGNNRLVLVSTNGFTTTNGLNATSATLWFGNPNDPVPSNNSRFLLMTNPIGLAVSAAGMVFVSEPANQDIRGLTTIIAAPPSTPVVVLPYFNPPAGIALNATADILFIADSTNNVIWTLNLKNNVTSTFLDSASGINNPVDVAVDSSDNLYVLNQGSGSNGTILEFDKYGILLDTNATGLTLPTAMKYVTTGDIYVTEQAGLVRKFNAGVSNTVSIINTNGNVRLQGITLLDNGSLVISDAGNHVIWKVAPGSTNATLFTGILGTSGAKLGATGVAKLNTPMFLAAAYGGYLAIVDSGNNRVVIADDSGTLFNVLNSTNANLWFGLSVDPVSAINPNFVSMLSPIGIAIGNSGTVFVSESTYKDIRGILNTGLIPLPPPPPAPVILSITANYVTLNNGQVTLNWSPATGAADYIVKRSQSSGSESPVASTGSATTYTDTNVINGNTYFYVVSAANAGGEGPNSGEVSIKVPLPPVPDPQIGYVEFPPPDFTSYFHAVSAAGVTFNNDRPIVIIGTTGSHTYYNYSNTPAATNVPDPTAASFEAGAGYVNGLSAIPSGTIVAQIMSNVCIKAIGIQAGHSNSAVVSALFQFVTANPVINDIGNGAGGFNIVDITTGSHLYYTLNGTDPSATNYAPNGDLGVALSSNQWLNVTFPITSNTLFKVRAFKDNYYPSAIVSNLFTVAGTHYTTITFGKAYGEPQSAFIARPGQYFCAPVTLQLLPGFGKMYSLQFNVAVTNGYTNIINGGAIPPVVNGDGIDFRSMLMTLVDPTEGRYYPPADGQWYLPIPMLISTNNLGLSMFINPKNNLLGVGWLYRTGFKYKASDTNGIVYLDFDTTKQDLITYSIGHDTLFGKAAGTVLAGAYSFRVPTNANIGDQYFIQLGSPSATADGVGAPNAGITIAPPALSQAVTVGTPTYVVGDVAPFSWFNAGDFGDYHRTQNTNGWIDNSDVMQVYQAAISLDPSGNGVNNPPPNSDLNLAMDSAGGFGAWDSVNGYYTNAGTASLLQQQATWDGNDLSINTNAFGDGVLDINDLYVTFRRSLDPSLTWFIRYWTNNQFIAITTPNLAYNSNSPHLTARPALAANASSTNDYRQSSINFSAGDAVVTANQTIQIPINAQIYGSYPLRVLGLSLTVIPLDGSPAITTPVTFTPVAGLGSPTITSSKGAASYSAAWLNSGISGLTGNTQIGTLTVTIPTNATSLSAYAVHFNKASGSPNGLAVFPRQTFTGLITLSSRTNSCYGDGIPDLWRLRWFGTANNILSGSNACPAGDGISNWKKFVAGVDPNAANNFPSVNARSPIPNGYNRSIHWPTVSGKQYVIERSSSLFSGDWTIIQTNTGTGTDMEFDDNVKGAAHFYRVRILP